LPAASTIGRNHFLASAAGSFFHCSDAAATWGSSMRPRRTAMSSARNADGDFFGRHGADIESDRRVDARETLERHPLFDERVVNLLDLRLAADEADIAQVARRERSKRIEVVAVTARHDDDVRRLRNLRLVQPVWNRIDDHFVGVGKPFRVGELLAIVENMDAEARRTCDSRQLVTDVPGAHDVKLRGRFNGLDIHRHLSPANETRLLREIIGEIVLDEPRLPREQRFPRFAECVVLVAAAADGARIRPSGYTSILAPTRCGVDPWAATMVTSATSSPRSSALTSSVRTSWLIRLSYRTCRCRGWPANLRNNPISSKRRLPRARGSRRSRWAGA
jgi:hypothetical protein